MNEQKYTQYDWASDRLARQSWADEEERLLNGIDRRMRRSKRTNKSNKKNHRNYV